MLELRGHPRAGEPRFWGLSSAGTVAAPRASGQRLSTRLRGAVGGCPPAGRCPVPAVHRVVLDPGPWRSRRPCRRGCPVPDARVSLCSAAARVPSVPGPNGPSTRLLRYPVPHSACARYPLSQQPVPSTGGSQCPSPEPLVPGPQSTNARSRRYPVPRCLCPVPVILAP